MVRILKVKDLEDHKRFILAKSEMHRQTMKLEIANLRFSTALLKKRLKFFRSASLLLGTAAPLAGLIMARKRAKQTQRGGFIGKLFAAVQLLGHLKPILGSIAAGRPREIRHVVRERERGNISQYL
jgi:hypothetical protein